ncbi:hypothetical protein GQ457_06G011420 [Hibiscus cannabinus]
MATIAMHKWEKFVTHPGSVEPNQKAINVTLVQEFYAHLTSPTQSSVYVRGEHIQFTAAKINKFYGLQNTADNHSKFVSGLKGKSNDFLLEDLCIPGANWDSANTLVDRDRLKPEGKLWMHFIKQSLMPTSHTAAASLSRLQLLHSILNGRSIDVGKIIVDEAYAYLTRKSSPLLFPHLITALCRKKGVFESPEDLQKKGRLGITAENIPSLMGFDETAPAKQPMGGARTVVAAKLAALTIMAENTRDQLEGLRTDLRTYFNYVQERDQVIKVNFNEMLPQSSLNFPAFPQDLLKPRCQSNSLPLNMQLTNPKTNHLDPTLPVPHQHLLMQPHSTNHHPHKEGRGKNQQIPQQHRQWWLIVKKLQHLRKKNLSAHPHHLLQPPLFEEGPKEQPSVSLLMTARRRCNQVLERKTNQRSYHQPTRRA